MNSNVPAGAAKLLDFIGRLETGRSDASAYDIIVFYKQDKLPKKLTEYTIDELLEAQKSWAKNWKGSAAGKYQIIRKTLAGLVAQLGIPGSAKFTPDLQDRLGFQLLTNRGWQAYASGQVTSGAYALQLAREWASLPVLTTTQGAHRQVTRGQSYYAGDGVNKAHADAAEFERLLATVKPGAEVVVVAGGGGAGGAGGSGQNYGAGGAGGAAAGAQASTPKRGIMGWLIFAAVAVAALVYVIGFVRF